MFGVSSTSIDFTTSNRDSNNDTTDDIEVQ